MSLTRNPPVLHSRINSREYIIFEHSSENSKNDDPDSGWMPKLKAYPHFDKTISLKKGYELATNETSVKAHTFFPFLHYNVSTKKFGAKKSKVRPILYAARKDSCVYSYYRHLLSKPYEGILREKGLNECVIAYRRIIYEEDGKKRGKCNIHFANEAFEEIKRRNGCIAIALDISSFFESLNHELIRQKLCEILAKEWLPDDYYQVYKNITNYKMVDLDECYKRLGLMAIKTVSGKTKKEYTFSRKEQPKQLCHYPEFRTKIAGGKNQYSPLIKNNPNLHKSCGIPQGSPISDVIANMYMLDFDIAMKQLADEKEGYYRRYSDDILFIIPSNVNSIQEIMDSINNYIEKQQLTINKNKTIITKSYINDNSLVLENFDKEGEKLNKPFFEYLGFSFDGKKKLIRDSSLTRYYKKLKGAIKAQVIRDIEEAKRNHKQLSLSCINQSIIFSKFSKRLWKKCGRKLSASFIGYAKSAIEIMKDRALEKQIRNHKNFIRKEIIIQYNKLT